jgi:hypothetical protein
MALNYPKDMGTEWNKLKQDVKNAFTSANSRQPYQKIAAGILKVSTSLEILAGAYLKFIWSTGGDGIYAGRFQYLGSPHDGFLVFNRSGTLALSSFSKVSDGSGYTGIWDKTGNVVVSDDGASGKGLARPWISHSFTNTTEISAPPTSRQTANTTDTALVSTITPIQHPRMTIWLYVYIQTSPATATIKVKDITTGETLYTSAAVAGGYQNFTFNMGTWIFGDNHQIDITIARASGTGNVGLTVLSLTGRQS